MFTYTATHVWNQYWWTLYRIFHLSMACLLSHVWIFYWVHIALDKKGYQENVFPISPWKYMLWHSLEVPHWGTSNEYHKISFRGEIRKISTSFYQKQEPYLELYVHKYIYISGIFPSGFIDHSFTSTGLVQTHLCWNFVYLGLHSLLWLVYPDT